MSLDKLNATLVAEVAALDDEGRAKAPERIIVGYVPGRLGGPRYRLHGSDRDFLRMNSNSYLSLSNHPDADRGRRPRAAHGSAPGLAPCASSTAPRARTSRSSRASRGSSAAGGTHLQLGLHDRARPRDHAHGGPDTFWIGDELNHNCIIRAMRIANVPKEQRAIFRHNDLADLERQLAAVPDGIGRVVVIFDGIFSMRGDNAPLDEIRAARAPARAPLPRRRGDGDGRLARHRRVRADRPRHGGALRRARRRARRHLRQGVRRERRLRRGQPRARRGGPAEGGHLHLHEPARRGRLRGGGRRGRDRRRRRGARAPREPAGAHARSSGAGSRRSASSRSPGRTRSSRLLVRDTQARVRAMVAGCSSAASSPSASPPRGAEGRRDDPLPDQRGAHTESRHRRAAPAR